MTPESDCKTRAEMASRLDVSERTIADLLSRGVVTLARDRWGNQIKARYDLSASTVAYIRALRADRNPDKDEATVEYERARNEKIRSQGQEAALKLAIMKGEAHWTGDILAILAPQFVAFRQKMLGIPTKTARLLAAESDYLAIQKLLVAEVEAALTELRGLEEGKNGKTHFVRQKKSKAS